ncbi:hypothetical protein PTSG_03820 [Salpingoeca rosetta]|uniref:Carboxypeptidase n=1 Tax=Salpingoeca rosetta (strain ATCC 50818 / BSB-021) TaxID=946362 RepID=F2U5H4_SALR5|nr:uncharacterized protein PTSG_03820 [Salpingoeca rosetta]EGD83190.1 hypothetical protein PTSG_03820 [Salpingoeca rosetta]|eukprot:XP_004995554.1 hypothetical protein PTSG_03820 [Salpingoeca rosetta]
MMMMIKSAVVFAGVVGVLACVLLAQPAAAFHRRIYGVHENMHAAPGADVGEPLLVSNVRERYGVEAAQGAAKVNGIGNYTSYAGFYTVNKTTDNNLFVWYFPSQDNNPDAPLLIWLQGGPGGASTFGLFSEIGPFHVDENMKLHERDTTWNSNYSLLFIDNPVGAGYSYTGTGKGYATNTREDVARDLYACLTEFYATFPDQAKVDLYLTGESFAGHYIPAFAAYIHRKNAASSDASKIPLKGVSIGDGWTDPVVQMQAIPGLMFNLGLADHNQRDVLQQYTDQTVKAINNGNYTLAFDIWDEMLNGDVYKYPTYFYNLTGTLDYDNFLRTISPASFGYYSKFISQDWVRKAIHVGNATLNSGLECELHLIPDVMVSYKPELALVMDNYKVLMYNGQLDLIVGVPLTERYLPTIPWSGAKKFNSADRVVWKVKKSDTEVAGYVRAAQDFRYVVVRVAGHIAPYDQGRAVKDMVTRFIEDKPF